MPTSLVAYFDGLNEPHNPDGYACGGFVILPHESNGGEAVTGHRCFGHGKGMTNNYAEYSAALLALEAIWKSGWRGPVTLRGDSQLVIRQFTGQYACRSESLVPLLQRLRKAATCFASLSLEWVRREANEEADYQSRLAYCAVTGKEAPRRKRGVTAGGEM